MRYRAGSPRCTVIGVFVTGVIATLGGDSGNGAIAVAARESGVLMASGAAPAVAASHRTGTRSSGGVINLSRTSTHNAWATAGRRRSPASSAASASANAIAAFPSSVNPIWFMPPPLSAPALVIQPID